MLFNYLMIGAAALAGSVMSSPMGESHTGGIQVGIGGGIQFFGHQKARYNQCLATIVQVKQPVIESCNAGQVDMVKSHLKKVHKPVADISDHFKASASEIVKVEKKKVVEQSQQFVAVLKEFEAVLIVIQKHPKVSSGCTDVFAELDVSFTSICTEFKKHDVQIHQVIKESSIQISLWVSLGFKFQSSY